MPKPPRGWFGPWFNIKPKGTPMRYIYGDVLRLEAEGNAWRVKVNGTLRHSGTFTEGVLAGVTRCGIVSRVVSYTALGFIDDFAAGSLVAAPASGSAPPRANCGVRI